MPLTVSPFDQPSVLEKDEFVEFVLPADALVVAGPPMFKDLESGWQGDTANGKWYRLGDGRIVARMTAQDMRWCLALANAITSQQFRSKLGKEQNK